MNVFTPHREAFLDVDRPWQPDDLSRTAVKVLHHAGVGMLRGKATRQCARARVQGEGQPCHGVRPC
eukprot:901613-Prorocentrum_lima.AAC.1